jgi:fructuronate reductase
MVFDRLLAAGDGRWGVHAVGMRQAALVEALRAQDGLYAVRVSDAQSVRWTVPAALWRLSLLSAERDTVLAAMARPALRWITLTVTEKGYTPELGTLIAQGLALRRSAGAGGVTLASCDNLRSNGSHLRQLVLQACEQADLRHWVETNCAFPSSMVDRIVPASSPDLREQVVQELGVIDESPLGTEGFWEWVIEDRLADPTDAAALSWAGVRVTPDVPVYEEAKLRMLNGSHTAMALMGAITGRAFIGHCITHPPLREYVCRLMEREVAPHLQRSDWAAYRDALLERFSNPHLRHSVHQIATDSSLKIPQRWPASILAQLAQGGLVDHHALAAAAWLRYGLGIDESGQAYEIRDPDADRLRALAIDQRSAPRASVQALLSQTSWWGGELVHNSAWLERVCHWHQCILDRGMDRTIEQLLGEIP